MLSGESALIQERFSRSTHEKKELLWLDIEKNRFDAYDFVGRKPEELMVWFDKHLNTNGAT